MIFVKEGVDLRRLSPQMALAAGVAHGCYADRRYHLVITSGADGEHKEGSLHPVGQALDFRIPQFGEPDLDALARAVRLALGPQFDVVLEPDHLHVEFDPESKGRAWT